MILVTQLRDAKEKKGDQFLTAPNESTVTLRGQTVIYIDQVTSCACVDNVVLIFFLLPRLLLSI